MAAVYFDVPASSVLPIFFDSYDSNGASVTISGLAVTDIEIYKGTSMTQRSSDNGYALIDTDGIDVDSITGIHGFSIDLSDNSDAGFYAVGSYYNVVVSTITVSAQTVSFIAARFRIVAAEGVTGKPKVDVDAFGGSAGTFASGRPEVNTTHAAGTAWGSGAITAASIAADAITAAKVADGTIDAATFAASAITATAIASDAITAAKIANGAIDAATFAAGAIDAAALAADAGTEIAAAVWDMDATGHQTQGTFGQAIGDPVADTNTIFKAVVTDATLATVGLDVAGAATSADIATAVWQDTTAGDFTVASSIGKALYTGNFVPGAAGGLFIAGTNAATTVNFTGNLSGSVGSVTGAVGSVTGLTASDVGAIKTKTDSLTYTVAGVVDANIQRVNDVVVTGTGAEGVDPWGP